MPDIVGNLRVDQAWGSAQIMGSLHQVGGRYYSSADRQSTRGTCSARQHQRLRSSRRQVGLGSRCRLDLEDAVGCQGHPVRRDCLRRRQCPRGRVRHGQQLRPEVRWHWPAVSSATVSSVRRAVIRRLRRLAFELTTAWGGTVAFEHYWTPALRTSWVFGYMNVEYNDTAKALIAAERLSARCCGRRPSWWPNVSNCNPDWSSGVLPRARCGTRLPTSMWVLKSPTRRSTPPCGRHAVLAGSCQLKACNTRLCTSSTTSRVWSATLRVQRSFWP